MRPKELLINDRKREIVRLYFKSGSVGFGEFPLSDPELPPSPYYLHYPKKGKELSILPGLFRLIGQEMHATLEEHGIHPKKIAGIPNGGNALAKNLVRNYIEPNKLVTFEKHENPGQHQFSGPSEGTWNKGDDLLPVEDHTSGAHNKKLFLPIAWDAGFVTPYMIDVVDREQGGVEAMAKMGVTKVSVFVVSEFMRVAYDQNLIDRDQLQIVRNYHRNLSAN
jgi:orotate phosphoribosyltransferase